MLKSYQFQCLLRQLLTVLINVQLGFLEKQRNWGVHILQESNKAWMYRKKEFLWRTAKSQPEGDVWNKDGQKQLFCLQNKVKFEWDWVRDRQHDSFLYQHNSRFFFFSPSGQYVLWNVFCFTNRWFSGKPGRELTKNFLTMFRLKQDASVEEKLAIRDRKIKLSGLLGIRNDFSATEVTTF